LTAKKKGREEEKKKEERRKPKARKKKCSHSRLQTEKEWSKALIGRYLKVDDPESLERAYNSLKMILPETPAPTPGWCEDLARRYRGQKSQGRSGQPERLRRYELRRRSRKVWIYQAALWPLTWKWATNWRMS
jgi:hypothetical protein